MIDVAVDCHVFLIRQHQCRRFLHSLIFVCRLHFREHRDVGHRIDVLLGVAQIVAVSYMAIALGRLAQSWNLRDGYELVRTSLQAAKTEVQTLFMYGAKQILVVSTVTFSQWLIQRKIVYGDGWASENAIYSVGNQIFNMMTFIPLIITPIIITRLAAAGDDMSARRRISLASLKLFSGIAAIACVAVFVGLRIGIPFLPPLRL